jgi:hypothetical protein
LYHCRQSNLEKATLTRFLKGGESVDPAVFQDPFPDSENQKPAMKCLNVLKLSFGGRVNLEHSQTDIRANLNAFMVSYNGITAKIFATDNGYILTLTVIRWLRTFPEKTCPAR